MFRLLDDWRIVLRRAWSIRLLGAAAVLSGAEAALPYAYDFLPIRPGIFAVLSAVATGLAFIARLLAQKNMEQNP